MTDRNIIEGMSREQLIDHITSVEDVVRTQRATIAHQQQTIEVLQKQAQKYYKAASDYVPPPENDYD